MFEFESCIWDICFKTPDSGDTKYMDDHVILVTGRQAGNKHQQVYSYCAAP